MSKKYNTSSENEVLAIARLAIVVHPIVDIFLLKKSYEETYWLSDTYSVRSVYDVY